MAQSAQKAEVGRVVRRTMEVIRSDFPLLAGLATIFVLAPGAAIGAAQTLTHHTGQFSTLLGTMVLNLGAMMFEIAAIHVAAARFKGGSATLAYCASQSLMRFPTVFAVRFLIGLGTGLGLVLLIVPGLMLMTRWCVAVPAALLEKRDSSSAITRSDKLSQGSRWNILGLIGLWIAAAVAFGVADAVLMGLVSVFSLPTSQLVERLILSPIDTALVSLLIGVGVSALFHELRATREGAGVEAVAEVFA